MRQWLVLMSLVLLAACESQERQETPQIGTPERAARDSIIGQSQLPGAKVVEGARDVSATSKERAAMLDSIQ